MKKLKVLIFHIGIGITLSKRLNRCYVQSQKIQKHGISAKENFARIAHKNLIVQLMCKCGLTYLVTGFIFKSSQIKVKPVNLGCTCLFQKSKVLCPPRKYNMSWRWVGGEWVYKFVAPWISKDSPNYAPTMNFIFTSWWLWVTINNYQMVVCTLQKIRMMVCKKYWWRCATNTNGAVQQILMVESKKYWWWSAKNTDGCGQQILMMV